MMLAHSMDDFLTAVLNSMPTQLCVVDKNGEILAVNRAWERFALENGAGSLVNTGVGTNYLDICEQARGLFCDGALEVAAGLRAVLEGRLAEYSFAYPCPSPTQQRWYLAKISPLDSPLRGAVVMHIDISSLKPDEVPADGQPSRLSSPGLAGGAASTELLPFILELARELTGSHSAALTTWSPDQTSLLVEQADGHWTKFRGLRFTPSSDCSCRQALDSGQPVLRPTGGESPAEKVKARSPGQEQPRPYPSPPFIHAGESYICLPLKSGDASQGCLWLVNQSGWTPELQLSLQSFAAMAAAAMHCARLQELANTQMEYMNSLRTIDQAILAPADLHQLLALLIEHGMAQLGLDAGDVILFTPAGRPEMAAFQGFRRRPAPLLKGLVDRLCLCLNCEPQPVSSLPDAQREDYLRQRGLGGERFQFTCVAPVYAGQRLLALLEFFHRSRYDFSAEQRGFMEALAGQTALALQHQGLIHSLEDKGRELEEAYEKTITGWSRTLDLRDDITEGHSRRVTELALRLARQLKIDEVELVHIRRGALLHDIGKTGIPDQVLLKPGPLTAEELHIMNNHPVYAYDLLAPVTFLGPALDIPYCHHELWDGSGYPRGLHGEDIPLYARIFTVVDVYDSLVSTRHYRKAMQPHQALEYIQAQAGKKFDPYIAQVFLEMMHTHIDSPAVE